MGVLTRFLLVSLIVGRGWAEETEANITCYDAKYASFPGHVMCLEPKSCPDKELKVSEIDGQDKLAVLHSLNTFRSVIASGRTANFHPATNMRQLTWDEELATVAQRFADYCSDKAKFDVSVGRFSPGLVIVSDEQYPIKWDYKPAPHLMNLTKSLFSQAFDHSFLMKDVPRWRSTPTGDSFSQLIWANSHLVGCGFSMFNEQGTGFRMLVCLFGPKGNVVNASVYEKGEPDCPVKSKNYQGLCTATAVNRAFKPIPCSDKNFSASYNLLCTTEDKYLGWISPGLPFDRMPCDRQLQWRDLYHLTISATLTVLILSVLATIFVVYKFFKAKALASNVSNVVDE